MFQLGIERLLSEPDLHKKLFEKRLAFLGHPASTIQKLEHSLDCLNRVKGFKVVAAFGPQHGMRGEKQDNMIESADYVDPILRIPVHSLYGEVRKPTAEMLKGWDVLLIDLQDVGCRIYTFLTTLIYMMDALDGSSQEIWILDRPNPAGREIEGHRLDMKFASFVGAVPIPMRHGLTLGEAALWYKAYKNLKVNLHVVGMNGYQPTAAPGYGWPNVSWVNPSPNMPRLSTARAYCGTVLFEGTNLSEGRGTTIPLEIFGAPGMDIPKILKEMQTLAAKWMEGCLLRPAFFEPTFHKFKGELVSALQIHSDGPYYSPEAFKPYRLVTLFLKAAHRIHGDLDLWRKPPYEYETKLMPIDILSGHSQLRAWVEDSRPACDEWNESLLKDERSWEQERKPFLLY